MSSFVSLSPPVLKICALLSLKKDHFVRLIFSFKIFEEVRTKSLFLSFQNCFSAGYFAIFQEPLDQTS